MALTFNDKQIIPRNQLVMEHAKADQESIQAAVARINKALYSANSLPTNMDTKLFGDNTRVQNAVVELMKKAGYRLEHVSDQRDGDYYTVN